jgi:hypothetical protein
MHKTRKNLPVSLRVPFIVVNLEQEKIKYATAQSSRRTRQVLGEKRPHSGMPCEFAN